MLAVLVGVVSLGSMGRYAVGPLSPFIMEHFGLSKAQFGVLSSAVGLGAMSTAYVAGVLVDRVGVRRMILLGLLAIGAPLAAFLLPLGFPGSVGLLLLCGAGFSAISPLASNGTVTWFPPESRGLTVGLTQAGIPLGIALSALVLPRLALATSWKVALGALGLSVAGAGVALHGLYRSGPRALTSAPPSAGGDRRRSSLGPFSLIREDSMVWLYALTLSMAICQNSVISFLVPFLQDRWAVPVVTAGTLLSVSQFAGMAARPIMGLVSDRALGGRRKGLLAGLALCASAALALLAVSPEGLPGIVIGLLMLIVGMTTLGWPGLVLALSLEKARPGTGGAASGLAVAAMMTGALIGPTLFGFVVDVAAYRTGWLVLSCGLLSVTSLFLLRFRERAAGESTAPAEP